MYHTHPCVTLLLLGLLAACGRSGSAHRALVREPGTDSAAALPLITPDSIGPLALDSSLGFLRRRFLARDTLFYGEPGYPPYAAVSFPLHGLTAMATQFSKAIDPAKPADTWRVLGSGALPGGLRTPATYGELRSRIAGPVLIGGGLRLSAEFCSLRGIGFDLGEDPGDITFDSAGNPLNMPLDRAVGAVTISRSHERRPEARGRTTDWCATRAATAGH